MRLTLSASFTSYSKISFYRKRRTLHINKVLEKSISKRTLIAMSVFNKAFPKNLTSALMSSPHWKKVVLRILYKKLQEYILQEFCVTYQSEKNIPKSDRIYKSTACMTKTYLKLVPLAGCHGSRL